MIKAGVIGVGNCFSGLYQGLEFYKRHPEKEVIGILNPKIGQYSIDDIEFVSAFDVAKNKVGKGLNEAIYVKPNKVNWLKMSGGSPLVTEAPALDGVGLYVESLIEPLDNSHKKKELKQEIIKVIKESETEILVNYLPVGSDEATKFWAEIALETGCAFVNCIPSFIASKPEWEAKFKEKGIPIIGDDIKGQLGATIVHRALARLTAMRGITVKQTYQLNVGGNTDFLNMKELERLQSKKVSKTESVQSQLNKRLDDDDIHVGPSDFIPFLGNTKLCFINFEGNMWADIPYELELKLKVDDKANSAGIVVDCIRFAKKALDENKSGFQDVSCYYMKHPLKQLTDAEAFAVVNKERI